jgi:hypothetical protein
MTVFCSEHGCRVVVRALHNEDIVCSNANDEKNGDEVEKAHRLVIQDHMVKIVSGGEAEDHAQYRKNCEDKTSQL